jgi:hypothetical protein
MLRKKGLFMVSHTLHREVYLTKRQTHMNITPSLSQSSKLVGKLKELISDQPLRVEISKLEIYSSSRDITPLHLMYEPLLL